MSLKDGLSMHSVKGGRRTMEDFQAICDVPSSFGLGLLLVVCDGSMGREAAQTAIDRFPSAFKFAMLTATDAVTALRFALETTADETMHMYSGSTLSAVYITPDQAVAYACVLGDSPVLVRDLNGIKGAMPIHNVGIDEVERRAVLGNGASYHNQGYVYVTTGGRMTQLSRCLGVADLAAVLSQEPDIAAYALGKGSAIIVASDGVFLTHHTESAADEFKELLELVAAGMDAKDVVERAMRQGSHDNATAIVWRYSENA